MKTVIWHKTALKIIKTFPIEVRRELGYLIYRLQMGNKLNLPHTRPFKSIGSACFEIRVKGDDGEYRVFYCVKLKDKILVFHAFKKASQKTPKIEIETGRKRLREIIDEK